MWHRVSLGSGQVIWPGHHWKKSKQAAREMEVELGLKRAVRRRLPRARVLRLRFETAAPPATDSVSGAKALSG